MNDWEPKDWIALYAALVASAAMLWHFANLWRLWRDRARVELRIERSGQKPADGPLIRWLNLCVRNGSPNPIHIERIDLEGYEEAGITATLFSPFPCEIEPFRQRKAERLSLAGLLSQPKSLAVVDGYRRKWKLPRSELRKAILLAKEIQAEYDRIGLILLSKAA